MLNIVKILSLAALAGVTLSAPTASNSAGAGSASSSPSSSSGGGHSSASSSSSSPSSSSSSSGSHGGGNGGGNSTSSGGNDNGVTITVKNSCSNGLDVHKLDNGGGGGGGGDSGSTQVGAGSSHQFQVSSDWNGRIWGCKSGGNCGDYGSAVSLAEFLFKGYGGEDFYDVSFVDGFNLPISIAPQGGQGECKSPTCGSLPSCPKELKGEDGACKSACAAFNSDEYCCRGSYNSPEKCKASKYADVFKKGCPDAYSYAYDDKTSTFGCKADKYTVTFCPSGGGGGGGGSDSGSK